MEVDNIELTFDGRKILHGIYLRAESGKVTGILGRNGCGKTCLLRILFGDLNAKYSNIRKDGINQKNKLYRTLTTAYLPQHRLMPDGLILKKAFQFFDVDWETFIDQFSSFEKYRDAYTHELSSGELRVVELYLILDSNRKILLLDEPFSFIAPLYVEKFKVMIREKKKESALIITDHFYRDILDISDSIYFLKNGSSKLIKYKEELEAEGYINMKLG